MKVGDLIDAAMTLTEREFIRIVRNACKSVLHRTGFTPAHRSGLLSSDDIGLIYCETHKLIESKPSPIPEDIRARFLATRVATRYFLAILAKERKRKE
jgi:hypothetical protein